MRTLLIVSSVALLAACGQPQQAQQEPYSAPSSPDATTQQGYAAGESYMGQDTGAEGGRGSAATGATDQGLNGAAAGEAAANTQQTPETTP